MGEGQGNSVNFTSQNSNYLIQNLSTAFHIQPRYILLLTTNQLLGFSVQGLEAVTFYAEIGFVSSVVQMESRINHKPGGGEKVWEGGGRGRGRS